MAQVYIVAGAVAFIAIAYFFRCSFAQSYIDHCARLNKFAKDRCLVFTPSDNGSVISKLSQFPIFWEGRAHKVTNILSGRTAFGELLVFEHSYWVMRWLVTQTAAIVELRRKSIPNFTLCVERALFRDSSGIKFPERLGFSRMYRLQGDDEPVIRKLFSEKILMFFENNSGLSVESNGCDLLVFREKKRLEGVQLDDFINRCEELSDLFREDS